MTPYGLRRTNASHLVQVIPIAEAAARLGHSVDILTKHYVKRVNGQELLSNQILDDFYDCDH
jgi:integrase